MEIILIINCITSPIIIGIIAWGAFKSQKLAHKSQLEFEIKKAERSVRDAKLETKFLYKEMEICLADRIEGCLYTAEEMDMAKERMAFTIKQRIKNEQNFNSMFRKL